MFHDRHDGGRRLAARLERLRPEAPVVLALPRGGVPVAVEVARALGAPLDVLAVRQVGEPGSRVGAVAEGGVAVIDHGEALALGIGARELAALRDRALARVDEQARAYRSDRAPRDLVGRSVLLVDDGVGTGRSAVAAARAARRRGAARIILAVPVAGSAALARLGEELDEVVCIEVAPRVNWYGHAPRVSDAEITSALARHSRAAPETVELAGGGTGRLRLPEAARGAVVLATRTSPVAETLEHVGFATLELVPPADAHAAGRLEDAAARLRRVPAAERLGVGFYGSGAAAAAVLAAALGSDVRAVVAAGGRPDRAGAAIAGLTAAVLLVIGGEDRRVLRMAHDVRDQLTGCESGLAVVPGASHDFAERGALEQVAHLAAEWFAHHL